MPDELDQNHEITVDDNVVCIMLKGSMDVAIFQYMMDCLCSISSPTPNKLLLNLKNIRVISSADLGRLVLLSKKLDNHHNRNQLVLCNVSAQIMEALKITGLIRKFTIVPDAGDRDGGSCGMPAPLIPPQPSNIAKVTLWPPLTEVD